MKEKLSKLFKRIFRKKSIAPKDRRRGTFEKICFVIAFLVFLTYSLLLIYAFYWIVMSSFKTNREFYRDPFALPENWLFSNYLDAFEVLQYNGVNAIGMIFNSIWYSLGTVIIHILVCSATGYVFAKYEFKGKKLIYGIAIMAMIIPIIGGLASTYKLVYDLGLANSPLYLLTNLAGFGMHFIIMMSYFRGISGAYSEAAFMDGAGHAKTFFTIMLPLAQGPALALGVKQFIAVWNDYYTPLLYLDKMPTLATGLYYYRLELNYTSNEPVYFAGVVLSAIPVLILFAFFSDKIMENINVGGLKG